MLLYMFVMLLRMCVCVCLCLIAPGCVCSRLALHYVNDAQPHFSLSLSAVLGCLVTASGHCQPHQLSPICCITCSGPSYLPDCARRLCSWMDQTCEVKSGPSSLKGFQQSLGLRPSKCVDCLSRTRNQHAWWKVTEYIFLSTVRVNSLVYWNKQRIFSHLSLLFVGATAVPNGVCGFCDDCALLLRYTACLKT